MIKKLTVILFFATLFVNAQDTIRVKLEPKNGVERLMIYKVIGAKQDYISYSQFKNETFELVIPEGKGTGMYRLYYDIQNNGYFDILYNNEPVTVAFNPNSPDETAQFEDSEDNKIYQTYLNAISYQQSKLDSVQMVYFDATDKISLEEKYKTRLVALTELQDYFEKESETKLAHQFIKASKKHNSETVLKTAKDYLESLQNHFFDYIDFGNTDLRNSSLFVDKVIEYVFYLNGSEDAEINKNLKQNAIDNAMLKVGENFTVKGEILSSLMYSFAGQQDIEIVDYLKNNYYNLLPEQEKDTKFIGDIDNMLKGALGTIAPEITWKEGTKTMKLSELDIAEKYIVVFWSTTCSHCLNEIPKLYDYSKSLENVKVIAVALENDKFGFEYHIESLGNWINVLGMDKWENEIARNYNVNATPSYFVLDKDKKIIEKPNEWTDVKAYLEKD